MDDPNFSLILIEEIYFEFSLNFIKFLIKLMRNWQFFFRFRAPRNVGRRRCKFLIKLMRNWQLFYFPLSDHVVVCFQHQHQLCSSSRNLLLLLAQRLLIPLLERRNPGSANGARSDFVPLVNCSNTFSKSILSLLSLGWREFTHNMNCRYNNNNNINTSELLDWIRP